MIPSIAIIDRNTLSRLALQNLLTETFRNVEVYSYGCMDEFIRDSNRHFIHFFVSSDILFRHIDEFDTLRNQTTVLSEGPDKRSGYAGYQVLDISLTEEDIVGKLLKMQFVSRYEAESNDGMLRKPKEMEDLSPREKDVLRLMVKGLINKEIGEALGISPNTVIFHRNNICEKLQTRSIGRLTIFAVLSGVIDINEI